MSGALTGKVALVTGGTRGIGAAVVRDLSREGATVAFTYQASKKAADDLVMQIAERGGRALAICADGAVAANVKAAVESTVDAYGQVDILVNNAAIERSGLISDYSMDDFELMIAVNVRAVFVAIQESLRHMGNGGRIINIGSVSSDTMPVATHSIYSMTKAAVAGLTRGLARDLGPRGITVNNVQPGRIDTGLTREGWGHAIEKVKAGVALGRLGGPEEVSALVLFLASPAGAFVTGASLKVDGGATA